MYDHVLLELLLCATEVEIFNPLRKKAYFEGKKYIWKDTIKETLKSIFWIFTLDKKKAKTQKWDSICP